MPSSKFLTIPLAAAIYAMSPDAAHAATFKIVHSFGANTDGANSMANLTEAGGNLFGTTANGGTDGKGTVFEVVPTTGSETVLHSFSGGEDGGTPWSAPIDVNGVLYGTAPTGGEAGNGVLYQINPKSGATTTLWDFPVAANGAHPYGSLVKSRKSLFGATLSPAAIYRLNFQTGSVYTVRVFSGNEGGDIYGGLALKKGVLFGVASSGGSGGDFGGTAFEVLEKSGTERTIYNFQNGNDGGQPVATPLFNGGYLYGVAQSGGPNGRGVVYKINVASGIEEALHVFGSNPDGGVPFGALCYQSGALYGTTTVGGTAGYGTIFKIDVATGTETILYSFQASGDGYEPYGGVIFYKGSLYGTSAYGGSYGGGVVFQLMP